MPSDQERRSDRIEKNIDRLIDGIIKLNAAQLKTDDQIAELRDAQKQTDAQIAELRDAQKQTDAQIAELRDAQKQTDAQIAELRNAQKQTDAQIAELRDAQRQSDAELKEAQERTFQKLDEVGRQLGDLGLVQGEVAEDLFYRNLRSAFKERELNFSTIKRNVRKKGVAEYDIVAVNGRDVLVIEVKNKLHKRMVDGFVNKKLPKFTQAFPQYKDRRVLGGIGALVVKDDVGRYAQKAGLFVLSQTDDGGAAILNRKNFKAKSYTQKG